MVDGRLVGIAIAIAACSGEGACAMSQPAENQKCHIVGGEMLSPTSGGAGALCAAVEKAIAPLGTVQSVAVTVQNASRAAAVVTLTDGRVLPAVNVASSDRDLASSTFDMLARSIALQVNENSGK